MYLANIMKYDCRYKNCNTNYNINNALLIPSLGQGSSIKKLQYNHVSDKQ